MRKVDWDIRSPLRLGERDNGSTVCNSDRRYLQYIFRLLSGSSGATGRRGALSRMRIAGAT
jgi:hypothetical protein